MTCHSIRPNVRHIGILHLASISTTSPQSTCHSAPVSEILSKSDHPRQKKMASRRFSRQRISASWILGVQWWLLWKAHVRLRIGSHSSKLLIFKKNRVFLHFGDKWHTNRQTNEQMDSIDAFGRSRCRERQLNVLCIRQMSCLWTPTLVITVLIISISRLCPDGAAGHSDPSRSTLCNYWTNMPKIIYTVSQKNWTLSFEHNCGNTVRFNNSFTVADINYLPTNA